MMTLEKVNISGGSNLGDREANLEFALKSLSGGGTVSKVSSYFETEPVGFLDQPWFLNIAIELLTPSVHLICWRFV
jgi:2-amino-4-hydroxy-6-hydroxymethyldihydropteridine diphosphokinase